MRLNDAGLRRILPAAYRRVIAKSVGVADSAQVSSGWLTLAARDNVQIDRFTPGDPSEVSTIVLRIKGSDLAAYRTGKITLEEVRTRVDVREF